MKNSSVGGLDKEQKTKFEGAGESLRETLSDSDSYLRYDLSILINIKIESVGR